VVHGELSPRVARLKACGHRALVETAKVGARDGNVTEIRELRLRCTECDGTVFEGTIFSAQDQIDAFLAVLSKGGGRPGF